MKEGINYFDVGNVHSLRGNEDFNASGYRDFLDEYGGEDKPFWITEAGVNVGGKAKTIEQEDLSKITIPNYALAFSGETQRIFKLIRGHSSGSVLDTYLLMARTIGNFDTAALIADNIVQFDFLDGSTVFAIWDGAILSLKTTSNVNVITFDGSESSIETSEIIAEVPTLIVVKSGVESSNARTSITESHGREPSNKQLVEPTPDIDATVEARVAHERAVDATVEARLAEDRNSDAKTTIPPVPQTMGSPRQKPTDTPTSVPTATSVPTPRYKPTLAPTPVLWGGRYNMLVDQSLFGVFTGKTVRFKMGDSYAKETAT